MDIKRSMKRMFSGMALVTLLSFALFGGGLAQAYTLSGTVTKAADGQPLGGFNVDLYDVFTDTTSTYTWEEFLTETHTASNGTYSFTTHEGVMEFWGEDNTSLIGTWYGFMPGSDMDLTFNSDGTMTLEIFFFGGGGTTMGGSCSYTGTYTDNTTTFAFNFPTHSDPTCADEGPEQGRDLTLPYTLDLTEGVLKLDMAAMLGGGTNIGQDDSGTGGSDNSATEYLIQFGNPWGHTNYIAAWYESSAGAGDYTLWDGNTATKIVFSGANRTGIDGSVSEGKSISGSVKNSDGTVMTNSWDEGVGVEVFREVADDWGNFLMWTAWAEASIDDGSFTAQGLGAHSDYVVQAGDWDSVQAYWNGAGNPSSTTNYTKINTTAGNVTGIDIVMPQTVGISGTITVPSGTPDGVEVILFRKETSSSGFDEYTFFYWIKSIRLSGSTGNYILNGVGAGDYYVGAEKVDWMTWVTEYARTYYKSGSAGTASENEATAITVSNAPVTGINITLVTSVGISGTIQEESGSTVAAGYWVDAYSESGGWGFANVDANSSGAYTLSGLSPGPGYIVSISNQTNSNFKMWNGTVTSNAGVAAVAGTSDWNSATRIDLSGGSSVSGVDFDLAASNGSIAGTITATVTSDTNVFLDAFSESTWAGGFAQATVTSTTNPIYTLSGLDPSVTDYVLALWPDWNSDLQEAFFSGTIPSNGAVTLPTQTKNWNDATRIDLSAVTGSAVTNANFILTAGTSMAGSLTVPSGATSSSGLDAFVDMWSESSWQWGGGPVYIPQNNTVGIFTIKRLGDAADYRVSAWAPGLISVYYSGSKDGATDSSTTDWGSATPIDPTAVTGGVDLEMSGGSTVSGSITVPSAATSTIWMFLDAFNTSTWAWNWADASISSGSSSTNYFLTVSDGTWQITPWAWGFVATAKTVTVSGDTPNTNFALSTGSELTGTVTGGGSGLQNVWVDAMVSSSFMWAGGDVTNSSGNYTIAGLNGTYDITAWPPWDSDYAQSTATSVAVTTATTKDFTLSTGLSVSGQVLNSSPTGVANAWVSINDTGYTSWFGRETNSTGNYKIPGLVSGTAYEATVYASAYPIGTLSLNGGASLTGNLIGQDITLGSGVAITGTVSGTGFDASTVDGYVGLYKDNNGDGNVDVGSDTFLQCVVIENNGTYRTFPVPLGSQYVLMPFIPGFSGNTVTAGTDVSGKDITVSSTDSNNISGTVNLGSTAGQSGTVYINALNGSAFVNGTAATFSSSDTSVSFTITSLSISGSVDSLKAMAYDSSDASILGAEGTASTSTGSTGVSITLP